MAKNKKTIETLIHEEASRKNIPTAEFQSVMRKKDQNPIRVAYEHRNRDLDPQLVWRGKDEQDWSDLVVHAPPLYIQEKVHPKILIDDLKKQSESKQAKADQLDLFNDFNGISDEGAKTEFYQHDANWTNRMILGDSIQVMGSLAEREGLRGKVQCIYFDPPYGIKFNSNFQWSTTSRSVKDGNVDHITREPEQVKAFRDTWRDGVHSYLTYLRDRLTVARDLLAESGSIFVQIGDENVHIVRSLLDEVFGKSQFVSHIAVTKTTGLGTSVALPGRLDYILWYSKNFDVVKTRTIRIKGNNPKESGYNRIDPIRKNDGYYMSGDLTKPGPGRKYEISFFGKTYNPGRRWWGIPPDVFPRLYKADRLLTTKTTLRYKRFYSDFPLVQLNNLWTGLGGASDPTYVVQTNQTIIERCILLSSDPGDLILDPTCGSGTTAYTAEQWGRRWITIDTSRVALALARSRIMGAKYPYYILSDSIKGHQKEAQLSGKPFFKTETASDIRQGFVYERLPHITLKSIANNPEIDIIWGKFLNKMDQLNNQLNELLNKEWKEWEIPLELDETWSNEVKVIHRKWMKLKILRQKEIDASIVTISDFEYLYNKPYEDKKKVRVAGPFTVESISPHRVLVVDENDELINTTDYTEGTGTVEKDFVQMILENLKTAGVQQAHKEDKINFLSITPWPGDMICAEGRYTKSKNETGNEKRAAIFIGPEFGTVSRPDLVAAAREAGDADFDVLITCAFNYDAHSSDFDKLGRIPVLKARMNADLHMADDLKNTGKGNLFVIFGEPDIDILDTDEGQVQVKINGVDVFHPNTGEVRSDGAEGIACWFIDTDYNEESFFVRHAYFLGANDPYKALKTTLKTEINKEAWESLHSDISRPFEKPKSGRIAVKVINHLGDEVMKVFKVN